jgi:hypothetical protein
MYELKPYVRGKNIQINTLPDFVFSVLKHGFT